MWNWLLAAFSAWGVVCTWSAIATRAYAYGFETTCCGHWVYMGRGPVAWAMLLFIYSKLFELLDTAFLVAKKTDIIFLHWYHHITVLFYCWYAAGGWNRAGGARSFVAKRRPRPAPQPPPRSPRTRPPDRRRSVACSRAHLRRHSYSTRISNGIWFAAMNYFVHALMYAYFAMTQVRAPLPATRSAARARHANLRLASCVTLTRM
jgi:hypothetical protein